MKIINITTPGHYPPVQEWHSPTIPAGCAEFPEKFMPVYYMEGKRFAGFVKLTVTGNVVTDCVWDEEAYQAYCAASPEPEEPAYVPTETEQLRADVDYLLMMQES